MSDPDSLLEKYVKPFVRYQGNPLGALQVAGTIGQGLTGQILSGIKGLSVLPQGTEAAADAVNDYQKKWSELGNPLMGKAGVQAIQDIAPAFRGAAASPLGTAAHRLSSGYGEGSQKWSDLAGKYLGTPAAGAVGATADVLPYLMQPEGLLGKSALEAAPAVTRSFEPLLEDGAHAGTLAREQAAAARRAEDGVRSSDALPSEFQGRQAEHEGAVARRMAKTPRQISAVPATESHLAGAEPDNATVYTAKHPETGELLGHAVAVPRHGGMQMTLIEVDPKYRGEGIGRDLMNSVVADAHGQGLPLHSDTSVRVPQMANVQSSGHTVTMNPHTEEAESPYGPALESTNGQPVYSIHPPTSPEDVAANEPAQGSYVSSQAYAEGGEVGTVLGGLGRLVDQFAPLARHVEQNGGVTYHPGTGKQPVSGYAVSVHKGREASLPSAPDAHELARYTYANRDLFASDPGAHVGVWHDPGSGQHFMDVDAGDADAAPVVARPCRRASGS